MSVEESRRQAMTDGGESEGFPFRMFLRTAGGLVLAYVGIVIGATIIGSWASPLAWLSGMVVIGFGLITGTWLVGTAAEVSEE